MTDTVVIHKGALHKVSPYLYQVSYTVKMGLLSETSTAAPTVDDEYVDDLIPASNELVNDDYARVALTSKAATWNGTTDVWECTSDTVNFGALTGAHLDQGVLGYFLYVDVSGDDSLSVLIRTVIYDTAETLNGSDYLVAPHTTGWFTVGGA